MSLFDIFRRKRDSNGNISQALSLSAEKVVDMDDPNRALLAEKVIKMYSDKENFYSDDEVEEKVQGIRARGYKGRIIFHGGCLECKVTEVMGISECHGCYYYNWVTDNPAFNHNDKNFPNKAKLGIDEAFRDKYPEYFI